MISTYPPRRCGVGDYTAELCNSLYKVGRDRTEIEVLTYEEPGALTKESVAKNLTVYRLLNSRTVGWTLWRLVRRSPPDIIHLQSTSFLHPRAANTFVHFKDTTPFITTVHEAPTSRRLLHVIAFLRPVYKKSDRLLVHSNVTKRILNNIHHVTEDKVIHIPHGVDTHNFHPKVDTRNFIDKHDLHDSFVILFFGYIKPSKGIEFLLRAFARVIDRVRDVKLVVAGDMPVSGIEYSLRFTADSSYRFELLKLAKELGVEGATRFTGYIPRKEMPQCFGSADVVVFPYLGSAQSGPIHRALASGCPIIASNVGGVPEVIENGRTGLLVPPRDYEAIAKSILRLHEDRALRRELSENARRKAERELAWEIVAAKTIELYEELLS